MKSALVVLGVYGFFGALASVIALALGAPWWVAILSAIIIPPAFGFLAGKLVVHSVILYLDEKTKK